MNKRTRFGLFLAPDGGGGDGGSGDGDAGTGLFGGGLKIGDALASVTPAAGDPPVPPKKEGEVDPPEPKKETLEGKVVLDPAKDKKLPHQRFQELQDSRAKIQKELEEERLARKKEQDDWTLERQKLSTPVVPADFQKQFDAIKAEKDRMEKDFQAAIVQRAIHSEYVPKRNGFVEKLATIAKAAGDDSVVAAITRWDYDALADFGETLTSASQKRDWNRAIDAVSQIDEEIAEKSKNVEGGWDELQRKAQEQTVMAQRQRVEQNTILAESLYSKLTEAVPALKNAPELAAKVRSDMVAMAGGEGNSKFTADQVLQTVGEHAILSHICTQQTARIKDLEKSLAEKEEAVKKLNTGFTHEHVEEDLEVSESGTGLFSGGIVVRGR